MILVSVTLVQIRSKSVFFRITILPDSPATENSRQKAKPPSSHRAMRNKLVFKTDKKYSVLKGLGLVLPPLEKHIHILGKSVWFWPRCFLNLNFGCIFKLKVLK